MDVVLYVIFLALTLAMFLKIWFKTEAFAEYCNLFNLDKIFKFIKDYNVLKETAINITFVDYLLEYKNNFFTRLLSCPWCLGTWGGIGGGMIIKFLTGSWVTGLLTMLPIAALGILFYSLLLAIKVH